MSILILTGPDSARLNAHTIPREIVCQLAERAAAAGKNIAVRACRNEAEMAGCLRQADASHAEFVMFDPGSRANGELSGTVGALTIPYIEVHDDHFGALESTMTPAVPHQAHQVSVVQGYGPQSYVLALSIALEHLGCAECENEFHVGT